MFSDKPLSPRETFPRHDGPARLRHNCRGRCSATFRSPESKEAWRIPAGPNGCCWAEWKRIQPCHGERTRDHPAKVPESRPEWDRAPASSRIVGVGEKGEVLMGHSFSSPGI